MSTILITGASRGLGLEFSKQFVNDGWDVIATCREPEEAKLLRQIAVANIHQLDVDDQDSVESLKNTLGNLQIDVLLNNAGIIGQREGFGRIDYRSWNEAMSTNVFGPIRIAETFEENVLSSQDKKMVFITSRMGSISGASPNAYVYRSSKAALNMAVKCMSLELVAKGVTTLLFHPGHVQTDMGGNSAPLTPSESVTGMKQQILKCTKFQNGRFLNYDGTEIPW